jgi:nitrogen-specific signal transduction histidine kinase
MHHQPTEPALIVPRPLQEESVNQRRLRQFEGVFDLTTQMLATPNVDERLLLSLEAVTSGLGYDQAAIALIDERTSSLRMRVAIGCKDDGAVERLEMPLDSGSPQVAIVYEGRPVWLSRQGDNNSESFLAELGCQHDVLALPLFGGQRLSKNLNRNLARSPRMADKHWGPEPVTCLGVLYIGAKRDEVEDDAFEFLTRFADRVGQTVSSALHYERLTEVISKLQRERQWVESVMKSVADPIVLTNLDNEILLQNRRAEELFSGSKNANEGKRRALEMNDLLFSAYLSSAAFSASNFVQRDITLVDPIEGSDLHYEVISTPAFNTRSERIGLVSIFRDVTDLRNANEELALNILKLQQAEVEARRERDRLDLIIENVGQPVAVCDQRGNFILFNARAELLFQTPAADSHPGATAAVRANSVKLTSFIATLASDASTSVRQAEIELINPGTSEKLPMEITAVEVEDAKGEVTAVVSILHDLSEMRELERRRVEQQLFESEKLAAVGRLAASIAHEVNNPLEAIKNSLYLLQTSRDEATNTRFLEVARKETERVSHIIRQMLGFARRQGEVEWVNVNQVLEETMILIEKKLRQSGVRIERSLHPKLPAVRARADQLRQVFLNLLLNAQQSIEGAGEIRIGTASEEQALQPSIAIEISDSGLGISEEELPRIFEPFFSKRKKGTGLGLWVTQDIVRQHGGRIEVTSTRGAGTTFRIILLVDSPTLGS